MPSPPQYRQEAQETSTAVSKPGGSPQLVEQRLRFFEIGSPETLAEPAVNGREEITCFGPPALFAPQPRKVGRSNSSEFACCCRAIQIDRLKQDSL